MEQSSKKYKLDEVKVRLALKKGDPIYGSEEINSPAKAVTVMAGKLAEMDRECCCVVNLDAKGHPLNYNIVSMGDTCKTMIPMQNLFKSALLCNASSILMLHNHVSGSLQPSSFDEEVTKSVSAAARLMNIQFLDHIIVAAGTGDYFSFRDACPELFEGEQQGVAAMGICM